MIQRFYAAVNSSQDLAWISKSNRSWAVKCASIGPFWPPLVPSQLKKNLIQWSMTLMRLILCPIKQISWHSAYIVMTSHYSDGIMSPMASQITGVSMAYSTVSLGADQRKHQSSALLAFVRGIQRWPVNSPHKKVSNAENASIWWRHYESHDIGKFIFYRKLLFGLLWTKIIKIYALYLC